MTAIRLGYPVGKGLPVVPVDLPLKHLVITGQTQEAGKTTALEALIARSGLRAVTFITKRGEGSFLDARRIDPYFREQADWQFVASILEASRGEKLKFERAWIIRASKGARTLADVQRNVRKAMETAKGMSADVYLTLDAYLEAVVPQIARVRWAPALELAAGVNAMDLTALNVEMQHLVIKSSLDWVLAHETGVVIVIPEAWKFIPQGRGTPVKLAAEAFIRQAAGLKNFLWLDSQDIAGVEKIILKSVPVWVLGVQREANEIKRTLDNIPGGIAKPSKDDIATLQLGQFYACWGTHAIKTYVQPAWMMETAAVRIARGLDKADYHHAPKKEPSDMSYQADAERLSVENQTLRTENADLRRRLEALEITHGQKESDSSSHRSRPDTRQNNARDAHDDTANERAGVRTTASGTPPDRSARAFTPQESSDNEAFYQAIKARLVAEAPGVIRLLVTRPELEMTVQRKILTVDEFSIKGRIARLLKEGFFQERKSCGQVRTALKRTGPDANTANIGRALDDFTKDGFVTDEGSGYQEVPKMKVRIVELEPA